MKKFILGGFFLLVGSVPAFAQYEEKDFQLRPVAGFWFGPMTPFPGTEYADILSPALGGGAFFRLNIPSDNVLMEAGVSFYELTSLLTESLIEVPAYLAIVYKLPVDFALSFYFKAGAGMGYFLSKPEGNDGFLPVFYGGFETSFPAGKIANIGVRFDYYFVYESWMTAPTSGYNLVDGHFLSIGIMANFNTNP
jgi:hypothetical protein